MDRLDPREHFWGIVSFGIFWGVVVGGLAALNDHFLDGRHLTLRYWLTHLTFWVIAGQVLAWYTALKKARRKHEDTPTIGDLDPTTRRDLENQWSKQ